MRCLIWSFGSLAFLLSVASPARAYEEQATLGLALGYVGVPSSDTLPSSGVDFALSAGRGLGDAWSIGGLLSYGLFPDKDALHLAAAGIETTYALDIVRFVPVFGFGVDGLLSVRDRSARGDFALHALLGFDFLIDRRWLIGADLRGFWVATNAQSPLEPFIVTAAVRAGIRFDLH